MSTMLPIGEPVVQPADTVYIEVGTVEPLTDATDRPVAVLWIPDIEQRHGFREYYVKKQAAKPGSTPIGFRKVRPNDA